jgi:transposase
MFARGPPGSYPRLGRESVLQFGVDTHKATLSVAAVDAVGRVVAEAQFANDPAGHQALRCWALPLGPERCIGVEGSGAWGYGLAAALVAAGERVVEVPAALAQRQRRRTGRPGKSDAGDAIGIALAALRDAERLTPLTAAELDRDLAVLTSEWRELRRQRTRQANRLHAELGRVRPGYQSRVSSLRSGVGQRRVALLLRGDQSRPAEYCRRLLAELRRLERQQRQRRAELTQLVVERGTTLTALRGLGPILAAVILAEARHFALSAGRDAFAHYNGTAPIPASTGQTSGRQRLNRGGNRRLNHALHQMALTQIRCDPRAQALMARKQAEGKTWKEALRSLKRHLSNAVYHALRADQRIHALT